MAPIWGLGIAIINQESRSSTHVVQIPSLVMAPIWWVLGIASIKRNLFPEKLKWSTFIVSYIRSVLCSKRILLLGLARFYIYTICTPPLLSTPQSPQCCLKQTSQQNGYIIGILVFQMVTHGWWEILQASLSYCMVESPWDFCFVHLLHKPLG